MEEICDHEEAREVFEQDDKTVQLKDVLVRFHMCDQTEMFQDPTFFFLHRKTARRTSGGRTWVSARKFNIPALTLSLFHQLRTQPLISDNHSAKI